MGKGRILFVNQEIMPFVPETENSYIGRYLPAYTQEKGREIRVFMPRFSNVNERKNQEVEARRRYNLATKERMKIDEHRAIWIAADAAEQELRAEGELEDFVGRKQEI